MSLQYSFSPCLFCTSSSLFVMMLSDYRALVGWLTITIWKKCSVTHSWSLVSLSLNFSAELRDKFKTLGISAISAGSHLIQIHS